eukprot:499326-Hanusia_phi.AAC.1
MQEAMQSESGDSSDDEESDEEELKKEKQSGKKKGGSGKKDKNPVISKRFHRMRQLVKRRDFREE